MASGCRRHTVPARRSWAGGPRQAAGLPESSRRRRPAPEGAIGGGPEARRRGEGSGGKLLRACSGWTRDSRRSVRAASPFWFGPDTERAGPSAWPGGAWWAWRGGPESRRIRAGPGRAVRAGPGGGVWWAWLGPVGARVAPERDKPLIAAIATYCASWTGVAPESRGDAPVPPAGCARSLSARRRGDRRRGASGADGGHLGSGGGSAGREAALLLRRRTRSAARAGSGRAAAAGIARQCATRTWPGAETASPAGRRVGPCAASRSPPFAPPCQSRGGRSSVD